MSKRLSKTVTNCQTYCQKTIKNHMRYNFWLKFQFLTKISIFYQSFNPKVCLRILFSQFLENFNKVENTKNKEISIKRYNEKKL